MITKTDKKKIPGNQHVSDLQSGMKSFLQFSPQHQGPHNANFSLGFTYQHSGIGMFWSNIGIFAQPKGPVNSIQPTNHILQCNM